MNFPMQNLPKMQQKAGSALLSDPRGVHYQAALANVQARRLRVKADQPHLAMTNSSRTIREPSPMYFCTSSLPADADESAIGVCAPRRAPAASCPCPGGPYSSTPCAWPMQSMSRRMQASNSSGCLDGQLDHLALCTPQGDDRQDACPMETPKQPQNTGFIQISSVTPPKNSEAWDPCSASVHPRPPLTCGSCSGIAECMQELPWQAARRTLGSATPSDLPHLPPGYLMGNSNTHRSTKASPTTFSHQTLGNRDSNWAAMKPAPPAHTSLISLICWSRPPIMS